jgi:predicted nucleic-acid-binding protein
MISLDTNVLVRLIVDDEQAPQQVAAARARVQVEDTVCISQSVFLETMWVLERSYGYPRKTIADVAMRLLDHGKYRIADCALLMAAVEIHRVSSIAFGDALALAHARAMNATLITFDRNLVRLEGADAV